MAKSRAISLFYMSDTYSRQFAEIANSLEPGLAHSVERT